MDGEGVLCVEENASPPENCCSVSYKEKTRLELTRGMMHCRQNNTILKRYQHGNILTELIIQDFSFRCMQTAIAPNKCPQVRKNVLVRKLLPFEWMW